MKLTAYDRAITRRDFLEEHSAPRHRDTPAERKKQRKRLAEPRQLISQGHVRMFRELRTEGYSWRQIATICGVSWNTVKGSIRRADEGHVYPEVVATVIRCNRAAVGRPAGKRGAA